MSQETVNQRVKSQRERQKTESELAEVVISGGTGGRDQRPWYIALRPWMFCCVLLLLVELVTRFYYDTRLSLQKERFDNFPTPAAEKVFVAQMRRDTAYKIAYIGDSTVVGGALLGRYDSAPRRLERILQQARPDRPIHIWNFGLAGARAADMFCIFEKVREGRPDFVIINGNYFISAQNLDARPIAEPWLVRSLPTVPISVQKVLPSQTQQQKIDDRVTDFVEDNVRFIGLRQYINARLFGVQPRDPFENANPFVMNLVGVGKAIHVLKPKVYWQKNPPMKPIELRFKYSRDIKFNDINGQFQQELMREVTGSGLPAMTYITPQNPAVTSVCLPPDVYMQRRQVLKSILTVSGIPNVDLSELVPHHLFTDNDHMLAPGNQILAEALAREILPRIPR